MRLIGIIILIISLSSCIGAGTHGSIKKYNYAISKYELEAAVHKVIENNPHIYQDTVYPDLNYDGGYFKLKISHNGLTCVYISRFYGGKEYWDTSKKSALFIAYAYNEKHEGGSAGGKIKEYGSKFIRELIQPYEQEFILKVDSNLGMKHTEK